jgi:MFS family permease
MKAEKIQLAIAKYYAFCFFSQLLFFAPVLVLFYQQNHLSMAQILALQSAYSIAIVILEVPTGAIADRFGRRISLCAGSLIFSLGLAIYSAGSGFFTFMVAEIVAGVGGALISGADSAFIHSTLDAAGMRDQYKRVEGTAWAIRIAAGLFAGSLIGGVIARYSLRWTVIASAALTLVAFFIALTFNEPAAQKSTGTKKTFFAIVPESISVIREHKLVLWLFFYSSFFLGLGWQYIWYIQPILSAAGIPVIHFGWIYAVLGLAAIITSKLTHRITKHIGDGRSLFIPPILLLVTAGGLAFTSLPYAIGFFIFFEMFQGITRTLTNDAILHVIPSQKAATVLSINNLGFRLVYSVTGPAFGLIADLHGNSRIFLSMGISVAAVSLILLFGYRFVPEHFRR